ncbi:DUF1513 domain-containing protein [Paracoccus aerodenitrificans]|uniref:DUF1513 domain-containing protein n=1 Tax=Paracoccus aerodenitrificans TaxID=3017781 RepID=UPI0022F01F06|nr:DUF1513 domain-containing protein [Paracoccus aerodenitrificans]WBU64997.1 DUF1513 domain-containing protein [Paracoccus aerodenitrificans]
MADRRTLLKGLAAAAILPVRGWASVGAPDWVAAAKHSDGSYAMHGIDAEGRITFSVSLPDRGHAAAAHPYRAEAVAFARRPGTFGLVLDCRTGEVIRRLTPPAGRQFNGHGAFSGDGSLLYTSEVVAEGSVGRIGVWDVRDRYRRLDEWDSHGIGPHELRLLPDGNLVVANGGIETDPTDRTPLNLDRMRPNLAILDADGGLLLKREFAADLAQNSIRHLALLPAGIAFAMQWQGQKADPVPLLGLAIGDGPLTCHAPAAKDAYAMNFYAGSIAATPEGLIAITSPVGGVVMIHDASGAHLATMKRADICGAAARGRDSFTLTDGAGAVWAADRDGLRLLARHDLSWDNHMVRISPLS